MPPKRESKSLTAESPAPKKKKRSKKDEAAEAEEAARCAAILEQNDNDFVPGVEDREEEEEDEREDAEDDEYFGRSVAGPSGSNPGKSARGTPQAPKGQHFDLDTPKKIQIFNPTSYFFGWSDKWHPEFMYRLPGDVTLRTIKESGSEGIGRIEVGERLGMDTATKSGNRRVSGHIVTACKEYPQHIGQFQKMEGKIRCIKYFWKAQAQPERFQMLFDDFKKFSGRECPFKMGQTIKFPDTGLSTLRMSDVSLRRLNDILELLTQDAVLVTIHKLLKFIHTKELAQGYQFQIDKKSLLKCLKALEREHLLHVFDTVVETDAVKNKIQIVCRPSIRDVNCPEVVQAIQQTIDNYHREGRVFPHGQLRYSIKKRAELDKAAEEKQTDEVNLAKVDETNLETVPLESRYLLFRLMSSRMASVVESGSRKDKDTPDDKKEIAIGMEVDGEREENGDGERDQTLDETLNSTMGDVEMANGSSSSPSRDLTNNREKENEEDISVPRSGLLSDGLDDADALHVSIPSGLGHLMRRKDLYDPHNDYGYQSKLIRACAMHDLIFCFTHGHPGHGPTVYQRYPPGQDPQIFADRSVHDLHVYVDEESPRRFLPSCPAFPGLQPGWFMLQDLFCALPVSIFVLIAHVHKSVPKDLLTEILKDPIRRHTPLGDLPLALRRPLFRDKKAVKQVEHVMCMLCAMGLATMAPSPDAKRFATVHTSVFYVSRKGVLYDTSTSSRGYATVTLPIEQYKRYVYEFDSRSDVQLYWHHLRAISQSTPLNFRMDQNTSEVSPSRHKKYSMGMFEKHVITRDINSMMDVIEPIEPHDGCGGFDSAVFMHLKRHWDLNPRPSPIVSWFITWFRRNGEIARVTIEDRVANLQKDWNSFVRTLMPSDVEMTRKKKVKASSEAGLIPARALHSLSIEPKPRIPTAPKGGRHKKRPLDNVDLISQQNRLHMRCRFNARERDMLILVRAVGFFLNPVYRFWLDPSVVRDIMHEYVPESRTKTVQSLMAAGVREMVRPNRLAYLQRIVRNLSTFKEMRDLRFQLASNPLSATEAKIAFFKNAFNTANRLLFMESQHMPSTSANEASFEKFLAGGQTIVSAEQSRGNAPLPLRSQKPTSLGHIHHCVATNVLMSVLISYAKDEDDSRSDVILEQLQASVIHNTLQVLRSDGLVSRARALDPLQNLITKNPATLSYYFRHFFGHRFHPDLVDQVIQIIRMLDESDDVSSTEMGSYEDHAGAVLLAADSFYNRSVLDMVVDSSIIQMFGVGVEQNSTKQIRYLEAADLQLEKVKVYMSSIDEVDEEEVTVDELVKTLENSIPFDALPPIPLEEWLLEISVVERSSLRSVASAVQATDAFGATIEEIMTITKLTKAEANDVVKKLQDNYQVIEAGVDTRRIVWHAYSDAWLVNSDGRLIVPRPWTIPTGGICRSTVRWMAESILMAVVNKPSIQVKDLRFRYDFALQPAALDQIVNLLQHAGCLEVKEEQFQNMSLAGPFEEDPPNISIKYLSPTVQCIQKFARIFQNVPVLCITTSGPNGNVPLATTQKSSDVTKTLIPLLDETEDSKSIPLL